MDHKEIQFRPRKAKKSEGLWMMTFSDLSLILMCFFALLLSVSTVNSQKFDNITGNLSAKTPDQKKNEKNLKSIKASLSAEISKRKLNDQVQVKIEADGLKVEFLDQVLFQSGSAKPAQESAATVKHVLGLLARSPEKYKIAIEGHTDDVPLAGTKARSNWELSAARGLAILNEFRQMKVDERRIHIEAYASTRPRTPILGLKESDLAKARAQNRRVVIRLY